MPDPQYSFDTISRGVRILVIIGLIAAVIMLLALACSPCFGAEPSLRPLLDALWPVEASGQLNPPDGKAGERGPLQCGRAAWTDACEYGGVTWDYDTWCQDLARSEQVFVWYTSRYGARTWEERARCWNSGPKWRKKYRLTDGYWEKVKKEMAQ